MPSQQPVIETPLNGSAICASMLYFYLANLGPGWNEFRDIVGGFHLQPDGADITGQWTTQSGIVTVHSNPAGNPPRGSTTLSGPTAANASNIPLTAGANLPA